MSRDISAIIEFLLKNGIEYEVNDSTTLFDLSVQNRDFVSVLRILKLEFQFLKLVDLISEDKLTTVHLQNYDLKKIIRVSTLGLTEEGYKAISQDWHYGNWIVASSNEWEFPSPRRFKQSPKFFFKEIMRINNNLNGQGVFKFLTNGEEVVGGLFDIGYEYSQIESKAKGKKPAELYPDFKMINPSLRVFYNNLFCRCLERLYEVEPSDRAISMRMILEETIRIKVHLQFIKQLIDEFGVSFISQELDQRISEVGNLISEIYPHDTERSFSEIGGVSFDLPLKWRFVSQGVFKAVRSTFDLINKNIQKDPSFISRLSNKSISRSEAIDFGLSGIPLRSTGISYDVRKIFPYHFYHQVSFDSPLGLNGTPFDIFLIRIEETIQAIEIISQCTDNISMGPLSTSDWHDLREEKSETIFCESPFGSLGLYVKVNAAGEIKLAHWLTPVVFNICFFEKFINETEVEHLNINFNALAVNFSELER